MAHFHGRDGQATMTPVPTDDEAPPPPGLVLAEQLELPGRSIRWLATQLAGEGADRKTIENRRRYLQKVVGNPEWRPSAAMAVRLATPLGIPSSQLRQGRRVRRRRDPDLAERLEALVEKSSAVADRLERLLAVEEEQRLAAEVQRRDAESGRLPS